MIKLKSKIKIFFEGDIITVTHLLWGWREINIEFLNLRQPLLVNMPKIAIFSFFPTFETVA